MSYTSTRRRLFIPFALALFLGAAFVHAAEPKTVVVYGDSITAGGALAASDKRKLWVLQVQEQSGGKLTLVNEGKGGRPTESLPQFDEMLKRNPKVDALVIALGANDARDISPNCVPKAVNNIRNMVAKARGAYGQNIPILLVGPTNIRKDALGPTKPIGPQREAKVAELGTAFEAQAKELKCEYISLNGVVPEGSLTKDGVHPDGAGNDAIAKVMLPKVLALVGG